MCASQKPKKTSVTVGWELRASDSPLGHQSFSQCPQCSVMWVREPRNHYIFTDQIAFLTFHLVHPYVNKDTGKSDDPVAI